MTRRDDHGLGAAHAHGGRPARSDERTDGRTRTIRLGVLVGVAALVATPLVLDGGPDGAGSAPAAPERVAALMPASSPADARASTWYCAAGTAVAEGGMADHTVTMFNPGGEPLVASVTVFAGDMVGGAGVAGEQPSITREVPLPAGGEVALRLAEVVQAPLAAALVEVDGGDVAVAHRVSGPHGADVAPCSTLAAPTWHLAWGATTRDTRDVVVLFNPFPSAATIDAVFATEEGGREPVRLQGLPVPPRSVVGIDLGDDVTRSEHVSATFSARTGNIVIDHLQEYDGSLDVRGLSLTPGVSAPGETWVFADGEASTQAPVTPPPAAATDEDEDATDEDAGADDEADEAAPDDTEPADDEPIATERIVVYNPADERAEVDVQVLPDASDDAEDAAVPAPQPFGLSVGPGRFEVLDLGAEDRVPAGVAHTTVVRSTNGVAVVAERVTADRGPVPERRSRREEARPRRSEISVTAGSRLAAPVWRFLAIGDPADEASTVSFVVYNPDPGETVRVLVDLLPEAATAAGTADDEEDTDEDENEVSGPDGLTAPIRVAPGGRAVISLDADQASAATAAILEADGPVVVDRVLRLGDGRRRSLGGGIPAAAGAATLDDLVADGWLLAPRD
jgi:hypothetical protein